MSDIRVNRDHELGVEGATERLKGIEPKLKEKYGVTLAWAGSRAEVKGKGVSGQVTVQEAHIGLELKLGLLLKPLKSKIQEGIESQVDKALA